MPDVRGPALVTGASGFLGGNLARTLADADVPVALVLRPSTTRSLAGLDDHPSVTVHEHDGTAAGLRAIVQRVEPQACFHLASLFLASHCPGDVDALVESNIRFGAQLVESLTLDATDCVLVDTGTSWQHFASGDAYRPVNLYAATKQAFQDLLAFYCDARGLRAITLQLFDTYGPGDARPKLLALLARHARSGEPLKMSSGEQLLDLVHVDDVTAAFLRAAELLQAPGRDAGHVAYGVSSGAALSLRELVDLVGGVLGVPSPVELGALPYRDREVMVPWSPPQQLPGWSPQVPLREGLAEFLGGRDHG